MEAYLTFALEGGANPVLNLLVDIENSEIAEPTSSSDDSIKYECKQALDVLHQGNQEKALELMKDLCLKHEDSAVAHYVMGIVCVRIALTINDPNDKQQYLKKASESTRKSVTLSPDSFEFTLLYANLLFETANEGEYQEVEKECERALEIATQIHEEIRKSVVRVMQFQKEVESLIYKLKNAKECHENISTPKVVIDPLQNEEKFPVRVLEDPMEMTPLSNASEELRKELIELKATAALLLDNNKGLGSGLGMGKKVKDRRKIEKASRNISSAKITDIVRSYWNSLDLDKKKELLKVKISDLKKHYRISKERSVRKVLDEALSFGKDNRVWKFWLCCCCNAKFSDAELHRQHVKKEHMMTLLPKLQSFIPNRVDNDWTEMLLNCSWKPLDLKAAIKMLEEQSKLEEPNFLDESKPRNDKDDSSPEKSKLGNKKCLLYQNWPSNDDSECACLLEIIHVAFDLFIKLNYLASSHLRMVIHFAFQKLQGLADGFHLLDFNMDKTPLCICFLGASDLWKIVFYLKMIFHGILSSETYKYSDKSNSMDDSISCTQVVDTTEGITFALDDSVLVFERFLPCKLNSPLCADSGSDSILSWIFTGPPSGELLASWTCAREEKAQQGKEILEFHEKELYDLQGLCEKKCEGLNNEEALQAMNDLCRKDLIGSDDGISYESVLRKRREDLIGSDDGINLISSRFELEVIENILKKVESGEVDDGRTKDHLHQVDSYIEVAIQAQKEKASIELCNNDAKILQVLDWMQQLEVKLDSASTHDFRSILVPLMKSYLRAHLEDLAEKEATKKSNAAIEALLTELAGDSEKRGGNNSRKMHKRMKDKKKRENRRNKDSKAIDDNQLNRICNQSSEEISHISAPDGDDHVALTQQEESLEYKRQIENEAKQKHDTEQLVSSEKEIDEAGQLRYKRAPDGDGALQQKKLPEMVVLDYDPSHEVIADGINVIHTFPGLKNKLGEYNCFLNVIIQSLWHLRRFRDEILRSSSGHVHVGDPCVTCGFYDIFIALSKPPKDARREAVDPTSLRVALSNLYPDSKFFQKGQMNDASEVLGVIFDCLHKSFPCEPVVLEGAMECVGLSCIAHSLFGMDILERMKCDDCGLESRLQKYNSFFHNINATTLRKMKDMCPETSFDELLYIVEVIHQLRCDPEVGGCGKLNYIQLVLSAQPHFFTTVLGWKSSSENVDDITETLAALTTDINISLLYRGLDRKSKHCLVSVVCFYGQHYCCFAYKHERKRWFMCDDENVKEIGGWNDVLKMCVRGHMQPHVFFF